MLDDVDVRWMEWFTDLEHYRPSGFGPTAIPLQAILDYCRLVLEYPDERYFIHVISEIDRHVLKEAAAKETRQA